MSRPIIRTARQDRAAHILGAVCVVVITAAVVAMVLGAWVGGATW